MLVGKDIIVLNFINEALQLFENNQPDQAITLINEKYPEAKDGEKAAIAELYMQWGFLEEAIAILTELMNKHPEESELKVMLADLYIENNKDEEAMLLLNDITEEDDVYVQALVQLADLYEAQGLVEVAEQKLLAAKQHEPNEVILDFALGELYFSTGNYVKAINHYEKVTVPEIADISIKERLAESYASTGKYEKALAFYQQLDSENPDILFKYGFTASQTQRYDIAINTWEKVIEQDPYYHSVYYELAKVYEKEELVNEAYKTALAGLEVDEFNKQLYMLAAKFAHQLGENMESEKWISEAIALDPDYKEAILFKISLLKDHEDHAEIIEFIRYIQEEGDNDPLYDWELARAYNEEESYNEALNHYKKAYNNFNSDSDFLKEYGYFLMEEGRTAESLAIFDTYLKWHPEDFEIEELIQRFN